MFIYGLNEWSKSDLSLAFETTQIQSPASGQYLTNIFVVLNSRVPRKRESVMVQQQPVVRQQGFQKQQHQERESRSISSACRPTPLKISREEMMQDQKRHTHSSRKCACTHPRTRANLQFMHPCTRTHTCTRTCVHRCTHKNTRTCEKVHARAVTHVRARTPTHACTNLCTHANVYAHAHTHAKIQP